MVTFLYICTLVGSGIGAFLLLVSAVMAGSSPQQAATAAVGIGFAVIPYVFTRCVQLVDDRRLSALRHKELLEEMRRAKAGASAASDQPEGGRAEGGEPMLGKA